MQDAIAAAAAKATKLAAQANEASEDPRRGDGRRREGRREERRRSPERSRKRDDILDVNDRSRKRARKSSRSPPPSPFPRTTSDDFVIVLNICCRIDFFSVPGLRTSRKTLIPSD
jgi:hypothetical protein